MATSTGIELQPKEQETENENETECTIYLEKNIYSFYLLSLEDLQLNIDKRNNRILLLLSFISAFIQVTGLLLLLVKADVFPYYGLETSAAIHCTESSISSTPSELNYDACAINNKWQYAATFDIFCAKIIAMGVIFTFIASPSLSISRICFVVATVKKYKFRWILLLILQATIVCDGVYTMGALIFSQTEIVDIITLPIGFILIVEIDEKMYDIISHFNVYGDDLFSFKIMPKVLFNGTIYQKLHFLSIDCLLLVLGFFTLVFSIIIDYIIYQLTNLGNHGSWSPYTLKTITYFPLYVITFIVMIGFPVYFLYQHHRQR